MANIKSSLTKVFHLEFNNNPELFLHHNSGEDGWTLGGIYQKANPVQVNWDFISSLVVLCGTDIKRASVMLYNDKDTMERVKNIYYYKYWKPLKLDEVQSQKIADEIFTMAIVGGLRTATKLAQKIVGAKIDGIIGEKTIKRLNMYNEKQFDIFYDEAEIKHFENLAENNPKFIKYLNGWKNRAEYV